MTMKKFSTDIWTVAIIKDLDAEKHDKGFMDTCDFGSTVLFCDRKTVSNLLETGKWSAGHISNMLNHTEAVNLKKLLNELSK